MRRRIALITSTLALCAACTPPAPPSSEATTETVATAEACNTLEPDRDKLVLLREQAPSPALAELAGGPITPGLYDLSGGYVSGGAPEWSATRAAALQVSETASGVAFDYAGVGNNVEDRWTGAFSDGPPASIEYTCGLSGHVDVTFAAQANQLQLRVPDSRGVGTQTLIFTRRA